MDVEYRMREFIELQGLSVRQFEKRCGFANGWTGDLKSSIKFASVSVIHRNFPDLNIEWLLTGDGNMLNIPERGSAHLDENLIPVLPFAAVAGYMSDNNGVDLFNGESVSFADFSARGADCAIRVDGDSMYPRYNSGDILAIKILRDPSFFQWGRVYVLSTIQGCIVKKLYPFPGDENRIICHSENWEMFPDYTITKSDVLAVAIVVGHAGVE